MALAENFGEGHCALNLLESNRDGSADSGRTSYSCGPILLVPIGDQARHPAERTIHSLDAEKAFVPWNCVGELLCKPYGASLPYIFVRSVARKGTGKL